MICVITCDLNNNDISHKSLIIMEPSVRFELTTYALRMRRSTN